MGLKRKNLTGYMGGGVFKSKAPVSSSFRSGGATEVGTEKKVQSYKEYAKKMFGGGQLETGVKTTDIKAEVTGNGAEPKGPPLSGGGQGLNNFVNAHNEALASGQDYFVFEGKNYNVGKTQLSQV